METITWARMTSRTSIHPATRLGPVELTVADLDRQVDFYQTALGFRLHERRADRAELGAGGDALLRLVHHPGARRAHGTAGLYHFAVLLPARHELARRIARLFALRVVNHPTDHVMTESTYLSDAEGNGIELYVDTPEDGTFGFEGGRFVARDAQGNLRSGRDPLDLEVLFAELGSDPRLDDPLAEASRIGHVHLHVADLSDAVRFYDEVLGFDRMGVSEEWGMGFLSAGGYHHHIGLNTWLGEGIPSPPDDAIGLRHFTVVVPGEEDLEELKRRLATEGVPAHADQSGLRVRDPSRNGVVLRAEPAA
jgi:catechol 2,3-dioxygenase